MNLNLLFGCAGSKSKLGVGNCAFFTLQLVFIFSGDLNKLSLTEVWNASTFEDRFSFLSYFCKCVITELRLFIFRD